MIAFEFGSQVAVEGDAGHRRPVAVVVVRPPGRVAAERVARCDRVFEQGVAAVDPGVEDAGGRAVLVGRFGSGDEVVDPFGLFDLGEPAEERRVGVGSAQFGEVVYNFDGCGELAGSGVHEHDDPVVEDQLAGPDHEPGT